MSLHLASDMALGKGALGGVILGLSATSLMYLAGKVTGISGISSGLVLAEGEGWQVAYIAGLVSAGALLHFLSAGSFGSAAPPVSSLQVIVAAFLVGVGTRMAGGCTSGHGLLGLARLSPRSLAAVLTFLLSACLSASLLPSLLPFLSLSSLLSLLPGDLSRGMRGLSHSPLPFPPPLLPLLALLAAALLAKRRGSPSTAQAPSSPGLLLAAYLCALVFGLGLGVGGMCSPHRVLAFLAPLRPEGWDPSLAAVLGGGVMLLLVSLRLMSRKEIVLGAREGNLRIDSDLLGGAALFGLGWGMLGVCPGPGWVSLFHAAALRSNYLLYVPAMLLGMVARDAWAKKPSRCACDIM